MIDMDKHTERILKAINKLPSFVINEGEIVYSGRFGQSIKFGCNTSDNSPNIKIRCGQKSEIPDSPNQPVKEDIERDGSSIYLLDNGLPYNAQDDSELFDGEQIENKKILIKSDGIFISGRDNIKLRCINNITVDTPNFNVSGDEVQLGIRPEHLLVNQNKIFKYVGRLIWKMMPN